MLTHKSNVEWFIAKHKIITPIFFIYWYFFMRILPYAYQTYMLSFDDENWGQQKAERIAKFKFDVKKDYWHTEYWLQTMAEGKVLRGEDPSV